MDSNILIQIENGIAILTINREKALNALNKNVFTELNQFFGGDWKNYDGLKGVIITGAGQRAFVAGADITEFLGLGESGAALSQRGQDIFFLIEQFHLPVVAAVNGFALGGGCELAMACHIRYASENAKFGQPEVNLGIIPGYGGTQRLVQLIGKGRAMELLLTADMIGAAKALEFGLINAIIPQEDLLTHAKTVITKIATKAPIAIAKTIACVNANFEVNIDGFAQEVLSFGDLGRSEDFVEGATAFLEKRAPIFKGR
jgi:enoyl-CoA hydratase